MARRPRANRLENRTSRLKLTPRGKPYDFTVVSPGISVGYRRTKQGSGVWVLRRANGAGSSWTKKICLADDFEPSDGKNVATYFEAVDLARKLARGGDDSGRPATVKEAIDDYEADLRARGGAVANAGRIRKWVTPTLAAKPVGLLTTRELAAWRDGLLAGGMKPATLVRLCKATKAALNLCAKRDRRIANRNEWADSLSGISEDYQSRNPQRLTDDQVRAVVAAAYSVDRCFGVYVEVAAQTGARLSQIARLTCRDLLFDPPRLNVPGSRKGRSRKPGKRAVPISDSLAVRLKSRRPADAPLLLRGDDQPWQQSSKGDHEKLYEKAAAIAGVTGTIYALRHSSIVRALLKGVPVRVVAAAHDTSVSQVEKTYSAHISDFADKLTRSALIDLGEPVVLTSNVVPLTTRG
jgi:integrase